MLSQQGAIACRAKRYDESMGFVTSLNNRRLTPERMDQPGLPRDDHAAALAGLRRLNWASGTVAQLFESIAQFAQQQSASKLRVLDVASGGGDVAAGLVERGHRRGLQISVLGLDCSSQACDIARSRHASVQNLSFEQQDVLTQPLPGGFDVIVSSLFLHHLTDDEACKLLANMAQSARLGIAVSDLRRATAGWWIAQLACRTLSRSPVVHFDGPRSVEGAYTLGEMRSLCDTANLQSARIEKCWPWRMLITWSRP